ncbi:glycosyltransferase family 4 protein [Mariniluteicoccus endophyticus]
MAERLTIGLVCPYSLARPGGVQNHVLGLAGHLVGAGHEAHVLAPGSPAPDQLAAHGLTPERVTSTGLALPVPANGSTARIGFGPLTAARTRAWIDRLRPDVLHLHEPVTPSASLHALWAAPRRTAVVATFHSVADSSRLREAAGAVLGRCLARIDVAVAVSEAAAEQVRAPYRVDPAVVPNGFRQAEFAGAVSRTARPRITFLGRVDEPRKGLDTFVAAAGAIHAARPDAHLVVAGPGRRTLPAPMQRLDILSDADRARLLRSSDVVVTPNTGRESFGLVVIEALAAGAHVVASDLASFRAVVTDGDGRVHADLVPVADADALARAVLEAIRRPADERGRDHVGRYDWASVGPRLEAAYATARARRARGAHPG